MLNSGGMKRWKLPGAAICLLCPLVYTLSMSTSTTPTSKLKRQHRVLCYGDSLTAGTTSSDFVPYPYAPHLEAALKKDNVVVRHVGLPGWTTENMIDQLDGPVGLRSAIQAIQNPPLSLVIVLAGSNDIGYGSSAEDIISHLLKMHRVAWEAGVPRSLAVGIPPSGYQATNAEAKNLASQINDHLRRTSEGCTMAYEPFPFPFEPDGKNWDVDGLHFSPEGYRDLGESLAPVVRRILQEVDASEATKTS
jgi:lysophospholipase L1-like esterase